MGRNDQEGRGQVTQDRSIRRIVALAGNVNDLRAEGDTANSVILQLLRQRSTMLPQ